MTSNVIGALVVLQPAPNKQQEHPVLLQLACSAKCRLEIFSGVLSSPRQGVANLHENFCHLQAQRVRSQGGQRYQASHSCAQGCNQAIQQHMPDSLQKDHSAFTVPGKRYHMCVQSRVCVQAGITEP